MSAQLVAVGGTIRRCLPASASWASWELLVDEHHKPVGFDRVEVVERRFLRLHYSTTFEQVVTAAVVPDEGFAAVPDFRVGPSVGCSYMDIYLYMGASQTPVDPGLFSKAGANLWVSGLFIERDAS